MGSCWVSGIWSGRLGRRGCISGSLLRHLFILPHRFGTRRLSGFVSRMGEIRQILIAVVLGAKRTLFLLA